MFAIITITACSLIGSFLCSLMEAALYSIPHSRIESLKRKGHRGAKRLSKLRTTINEPIAAILVFNTVANTGGAAWAGALVAVHYGDQMLGIFSGIFTGAILFFSEIIPKSLGVTFANKLAPRLALVIQILIWIFWPLVKLSLALTHLWGKNSHLNYPTEEELRGMLLESAAGGHLTRRERLTMENVLDLENKIARRYMLPRNQIVYIDKNETMDEKLMKIAESGHTRFPLCDADLDHVIGIVHIKDVFKALARKEQFSVLIDFARKPTFLPETVTLDVLLREFQRNHTVLTLLVDEYGVVSGMITLENVLEELVGSIQDEFDSDVPAILKKGRQHFEVDAMCPVDEVEKKLQLELPETTADTIGGVVIEQIGHIPAKGEKVAIGHHEITVIQAEPTRVQRVLIKKFKFESDG